MVNREDTFEAFARHVSPGKVATFREFGFDVVMGRREGVFFMMPSMNAYSSIAIPAVAFLILDIATPQSLPPFAKLSITSTLETITSYPDIEQPWRRVLLQRPMDDSKASFLEELGERYVPRISEKEIRAYYEEDASTWALLQRLRRMDRSWQMKIRRRPYPFLLPGPIAR